MVTDARKQDIQGWIQNAAPNFVNISFIIFVLVFHDTVSNTYILS
jgi:hypothetical protein